jgi:AraC family transcriptional regulator
MKPRIKELHSKKLIGIRVEMTLSDDRIKELWRSFMPRREEIEYRVTSDFISLQNYGKNWDFSPDKRFEKWAVVEVSSTADIPENMEIYDLQGGKYAVFNHQGPASEAPKTMQYIFKEWLPKSEYTLDGREHFGVLPKGYNPMDPQATEEIWVPIKSK